MRNRIYLTLVSGLLLLFTSPIMAHIGDPGGVIPHIVTGEHLLMLVLAGVSLVFLIKKRRHPNK
jgi:hypothetical protein